MSKLINMTTRTENKVTRTVFKKLVSKFALAVGVLGITFSAWAISLDQAKQQGLVGEMSNGYLGVVVSNDDVEALVANVNKKRKGIYIKLARKNNITVQQVTALAGEKAITKTQPGHYIQMPNGDWVKK
ncbi:YdbL family protein [Colwellia asteriadis]|uniref:YdbL family protein n=1 Tax=Colwellia asteriadis TaxID=517723 RepID=A0ABN1L4L4_9GAMM